MTVMSRGQFLSLHVTFNIDRIKCNNICEPLKKLQMNKKYNIQRNENYKSFSEKMEMSTKKQLVTF